MNNIDKTLLSGSMGTMLLKLLSEKDMYGYELVKAIAERSKGIILTQEGALYPVLYQFSEAGYVSETKQPYKKRMTRIFYHLEPSGFELYEQLLHEYRQVADAMDMILNQET